MSDPSPIRVEFLPIADHNSTRIRPEPITNRSRTAPAAPTRNQVNLPGLAQDRPAGSDDARTSGFVAQTSANDHILDRRARRHLPRTFRLGSK